MHTKDATSRIALLAGVALILEGLYRMNDIHILFGVFLITNAVIHYNSL